MDPSAPGSFFSVQVLRFWQGLFFLPGILESRREKKMAENACRLCDTPISEGRKFCSQKHARKAYEEREQLRQRVYNLKASINRIESQPACVMSRAAKDRVQADMRESLEQAQDKLWRLSF